MKRFENCATGAYSLAVPMVRSRLQEHGCSLLDLDAVRFRLRAGVRLPGCVLPRRSAKAWTGLNIPAITGVIIGGSRLDALPRQMPLSARRVAVAFDARMAKFTGAVISCLMAPPVLLGKERVLRTSPRW